MTLRKNITPRWFRNIREIGRRPHRTKIKIGRTTSTTITGKIMITGKITEDNQANDIRTLKGTLC